MWPIHLVKAILKFSFIHSKQNLFLRLVPKECWAAAVSLQVSCETSTCFVVACTPGLCGLNAICQSSMSGGFQCQCAEGFRRDSSAKESDDCERRYSRCKSLLDFHYNGFMYMATKDNFHSERWPMTNIDLLLVKDQWVPVYLPAVSLNIADVFQKLMTVQIIPNVWAEVNVWTSMATGSHVTAPVLDIQATDVK